MKIRPMPARAKGSDTMSNATTPSNANRIFAVVALAVVAVVATVLVLVNLTGNDMSNTPAGDKPSATSTGNSPTASSTQDAGKPSTAPTAVPTAWSLEILPESMSASEALQSFTDDQWEAVAARNNLTVDALKQRLEGNPSMTVSKSGDLMSPGATP